MPINRRPLLFELFDNKESTDLLLEMMHGGEYEEVRAHAKRSPSEIEEQLRLFVSGKLPGDQLHWAVRDFESGPCVGSLQATASGGALYVGYQMATQSRGSGKATQALRWLVQELRRLSPEMPIRANVSIANIASMRVLSKNGFCLIVEGEGGCQHLFQLLHEA